MCLTTKKCSKCFEIKDKEEFSKDLSKKCGIKSSCKKCYNKSFLQGEVIKIDYKKCLNCKEILCSKNFSKDKYKKDGLNCYCKKCVNKKPKNISNTNCDYKKCKTCNIIKAKSLFNKNTSIKNGLSSNCKECISLYYKKYRKGKKYKYPPKNEFSKFKVNARNLILQSFRRSCGGVYKKSLKTEKLLGCSMIYFKKYLESLFSSNMSWDNYGKYTIGEKPVWNIDHKIPISLAKTEEDIIKLSHYTNLQPMWGLENIKKGVKILH